jgi:hypothetical protein
MRGTRVVILGSLALGSVPLLVLIFLHGPHWESRFERKYHGIREGMTEDEVRQVIGFDGTDQTSAPGYWCERGGTTPFVTGATVVLWEKDGEQIWVGFDEGRVVSKYFHDLNYL